MIVGRSDTDALDKLDSLPARSVYFSHVAVVILRLTCPRHKQSHH
jgi:hypothetical protein